MLMMDVEPTGLVPSLLCGFGPLLLNMAIFALIYPLVRDLSFQESSLSSLQLVLQALQARAVPTLSLEDATTSLPLSPFPMGVPGTPFLSHRGSPIGTPITTGNGLPPLSPNGCSPAEDTFGFPNVTSDQISARFQAMRDGLLEGDDDEGAKAGGYRPDRWTRDAHSRSSWGVAHHYAIRAMRIARQIPLFWIATSTQETTRWFVLGLERRWGRSGGGMVIPESRRSSAAGSASGSASGGGWAAAKRRKSSYR